MIDLRITALISCLFAFAAQAQEIFPAPIAQIALLPMPAAGRDDVTALLKNHWEAYFETAHPQAFGRESVRLGRYDLNGDGRSELVLMVMGAAWASGAGYPLVAAHWTDAGWEALGWSWGDPDTVFAVDEVVDGWRSIDTGTQVLRWDRGIYGRIDKTRP